MSREQISQNQLLLFFIQYFISTLIGFGASALFFSSQYDSLLVLCIGGLIGIISAYFFIKLAKRRPNEFLVHYGRDILPRFIHLPIMVIFSITFLQISAMILREYGDFIVQTYLPDTPLWAVISLFGMVIAVTARLGIANLFRIAQGLFPLVFIANIINLILIGKELRWERLIAFVTNHSGQGIFTGSFIITPFFGEVMILLFLFPYMIQKHKTLKSIIWGTFFSILLIGSNITSVLLLFGPNLASHLNYPLLEMIRYVRIADFIQNLDHLLISIWATTVFLKISILFLISVQIITHLFKLKDHRPLTFSLAAVMIALSINISNRMEAISQYYTPSWFTLIYIIEGLPFLYLIVDTIKRYFSKKSPK